MPQIPFWLLLRQAGLKYKRIWQNRSMFEDCINVASAGMLSLSYRIRLRFFPPPVSFYMSCLKCISEMYTVLKRNKKLVISRRDRMAFHELTASHFSDEGRNLLTLSELKVISYVVELLGVLL